MEKKEKITLRETVSSVRRGVAVLRKVSGGLFLAITVSAIVSGITPYAGIWFSARILEELAGARRPDVLWRWVILTVAVTGALEIIAKLLSFWEESRWEAFNYRRQTLMSNKCLTMDYPELESMENRDKLAQIDQYENWSGLGLGRLPVFYEAFLAHAVSTVSAIALCVGLFLTRVPASNPGMAWLDGPIGILALLAAIVLPTLAVPCLQDKVTAMSQGVAMADKARLGNRVFRAFGFLCSETGRALDIRMYGQQRIARYKMLRDSTFTADGPFARLDRGRGGALNAVGSALSALPTGAVYLYVCLKAAAGAFGIGMVTQYVGAVTALTDSVQELLKVVSNTKNNAMYVNMALDFLDIPNSMYKGSLTTEKRSDRQYEVEFKNVSFRYPGAENYALRNVSVKFKVGTRLAVVGENGSGKTTFIKLLCRLYDPEEGEIRLNGIDIKKYNYRDYMNIFSVVFQDFKLLSQPLGANVAGSAEYDAQRVTRALTDAGFGERLESLPEGLDTQLYRDYSGEGLQVSGGEAQKIAIARALYKDAPFIILDEPTAALDPVAEAEIYAKFNEISGDRTAIYISHRLSSCRFCDDILVFDHGQIAQHGPHEALLSDEKGKYHALWNSQSQYYT